MVLDTTKKEKQLIKEGYIPDKAQGKVTLKHKFKQLLTSKKKQMRATRKTSFDLLPYKGIATRDNFIRYKEGFAEVLELEGYNLGGMSDAEIYEIIDYYETLVKLYVLPFKMSTIYTPLDTTKQQQYYLNLASSTQNPKYKNLLHRTFLEMKWFAENNYNKEFYAIIYGDTVAELREAVGDFLRYCGQLKFKKVPYKKKRAFYFRLNNPSSAIFLDSGHKIPTTNKKDEVTLDFLCDTQPIGNVVFRDNLIQTGNTFMTTMYIYRFPGQPEGMWQAVLHNIPDSFVMTDIASQESGETLKKLQNAIREQYSRMLSEKEAYEAAIAEEEYVDLNALAKSIRKSEDTMKYFCIRLILYADTKADLEKRIVEVRKFLEKEQFGATTLLMEQEYEYQSMFLDHTSQSYLPNQRIGRDVPSSQIGTTFPANHVYLNDERGQHLGYSMTNGNIIFDAFELDGMYRKFYNLMILGEMGSGKSTLMKKLTANWATRGYLLRGFDKSGEYTELVKFFGGKIIPLDGSYGMINIFQIFPTAIDDTTNQIDEGASFTQHKAKLSTWYSILKPGVSPTELDIFSLILTSLYERFGFTEDNIDNPAHPFTNLASQQYPTLSDFIEELQTKLKSPDNTALVADNVERILLTMQNLKSSYGQLFDGYTTMEDVQHEQILFFNIDGLTALDNKPIIDAQMFNALNLFWASLINNGKEQVRRYRKRDIKFDEIIRSMLIIDECHNQINKENPRQVKFINTMQREGRKMFIGVTLATQSLTTMAPENVSSDEAEMLRDIYNFSQYKIYFKISPTNIPHLKRLSQNDITSSQIERIARFPQGHCLMNITGGSNIEFQVEASDQELELFAGGGKNAEDR